MIRVIVVDRFRLFREALALLLIKQGDVLVVGIAAEIGEALNSAPSLHPDVVVLRTSLREFLASAPVPALAKPQARFVVIDCNEQLASEWIRAGAAYCLPLDGSLEDLSIGIHMVGSRPPLSASAPDALGKAIDQSASMSTLGCRLTPREIEIVCLIGQGLANKEIAGALCIETHTVKNHVHNILEKLQVHRRADAIARLRGVGLIPEPTDSMRV